MAELAPNADDVWTAMEASRVCFMADVAGQQIAARPMSPIVRRNENLIWFISHRQSGKTADLMDDTPVTLMFQDDSSNCYTTITGAVSVVDDRDRIEV